MLKPCDDMGSPMLQTMFDEQGCLLDEALRFCDNGSPGECYEFLQEASVEFEPDSGGAWRGMSTEDHMTFAQNLSTSRQHSHECGCAG